MDTTRILIELNVNGRNVSIYSDAGRRLIDFLREDLHLMGTKEGCGEGECGSCTVLLGGKAVLSCLIPIEKAIGQEIITIEGIGETGKLHPLQVAMIEEGGVQCGFCTPGMIMSGVELLNRNSKPSKEDIISAIAGNLCRCTGYQKIIKAFDKAAQNISMGE